MAKNEWDVGTNVNSSYPNLYDMIVTGKYKYLLAPGIIPDNIEVIGGRLYLPAMWRTKTNIVETNHIWYIPFAPNGDLIEDYTNGSLMEIHPKYSLMVLSSRTPHCSAINEPVIYNMTSNSYREVAYNAETGNTVSLNSELYKSSQGKGFEMRIEPISHNPTNVQREMYLQIKNGTLHLNGLSSSANTFCD